MMAQDNEKELVLKLKKGDKHAFEAIFKSYSVRVFYVARKYNLEIADAENLVQDVFLKIWENREGLNEELSLGGYVQTIAKNTILNQNKRKISEYAYLQYFANSLFAIKQNSTDEQIHYTELIKNSQKLINQLPDQQKQIFLLRKETGLNNDEIADKLKISKRTVENQFYRAVKAIRNELLKIYAE